MSYLHRVLLLALCMSSLSLLTDLGLSQQLQGQAKPGSKETDSLKIRIVDRAGKSVANARVFAESKPLPILAPYLAGTRIEVRSNERGLARLELARHKIWSVWAVHDDAQLGRRASILVSGVAPGRARRLKLLPWPAWRLGLHKLDEWRKLVPKGLGLAFTADEPAHWMNYVMSSELFPSERCAFGPDASGILRPFFRMPLPAGNDVEVDLPPLPYGFYYAFLVDAAGSPLNVHWITHSFSKPPRPNHDLARHLKSLDFSGPAKARVFVHDARGKPIPGAQLRVTQSYYNEHGLRGSSRSDEHGMATVYLPAVNKLIGTAPSVQVQGFAADRAGTSIRVSAASAGTHKLELRALPASNWRILGLRKSDRILACSAQGVLSLDVAADGKLMLPALAEPWNLLLMRDGEATILRAAGDKSARLQRQTYDLSKLVDVHIQVHMQAGSAVRAGFVEIHPLSGIAGRQPRYAIGRDGLARFKILPGMYAVLAWSPERGDALTALEVPAEKKTFHTQLELRPMRQILGRVVDSQKEGISGVLVTVQGSSAVPQASKAGLNRSLLTKKLLGFGNGQVITDSDGSFSTFVSGRATHLVVRSSSRGRSSSNSYPLPADSGVIVVRR